MRADRLALGLSVILLGPLGACPGDDDDDDSGTSGAALGVSCTDVADPVCDPPGTQTGSVSAQELYQCNYWDSSQTLEVEFQQSGSATGVLVQIADFTGSGSFTTNTEGTTNITVSTEETGNLDAAGVEGSIREHRCTITATSNLSGITIPEVGEEPLLDVDLEVACPDGLGGGAVCAWDCTVSPATFLLSVKGCSVSQ